VDRIADILVIVDPTVIDQPAIAKAQALAMRFGASVELLACDTKYSHETRLAAELAARGDAALGGDLEPVLERWAEPLRNAGVEVSVQSIAGDPLHESVLTWLRNSPADLVLKDTHHHSLARRTFISNADWQLIRACPVPLLLTKHIHWRSPPVFVAAVDPGHANDAAAALDRRILEFTTALARRFGVEAHAAHAYLPATIAAAGPGGMPPPVNVSVEALEAEKLRRRSDIRQLVAEYGITDANLHLEMGVAAEFLPRIAGECHADVVVMGAIARSGLQRIFVGSTAERVLETMPCDVLVIKPPDFARDLPF
jgi:universal stress protein E